MRGRWVLNVVASYQKGLLAETLALCLLWCKGYRLRARRYKTRLGEIDLIVSRGRTLAFVEVKARPDLMQGLEAVHPVSRERIQRSALLFCQANPGFDGHNWRFDTIVVRPRGLPYHLKDAWRP